MTYIWAVLASEDIMMNVASRTVMTRTLWGENLVSILNNLVSGFTYSKGDISTRSVLPQCARAALVALYDAFQN
jgi:hypothetical protein